MTTAAGHFFFVKIQDVHQFLVAIHLGGGFRLGFNRVAMSNDLGLATADDAISLLEHHIEHLARSQASQSKGSGKEKKRFPESFRDFAVDVQ